MKVGKQIKKELADYKWLTNTMKEQKEEGCPKDLIVFIREHLESMLDKDLDVLRWKITGLMAQRDSAMEMARVAILLTILSCLSQNQDVIVSIGSVMERIGLGLLIAAGILMICSFFAASAYQKTKSILSILDGLINEEIVRRKEVAEINAVVVQNTERKWRLRGVEIKFIKDKN